MLPKALPFKRLTSKGSAHMRRSDCRVSGQHAPRPMAERLLSCGPMLTSCKLTHESGQQV